MLHREHLAAVDSETLDLKRRGVSEWSDVAEVVVAGDDLAPAAPTIYASSANLAIDLTLTKPTTNADGTTCTDFQEFKIYYSSSPGIDISDPTSYDGAFYTPSTKYTYATTSTSRIYFVATAWDKNENESAASSEVSALAISNPTLVSIDDYSDNFKDVHVGDGMIGIEFQSPKDTWVRFAAWKLYYDVDDGSGWTGTWSLIYTGAGPGFLHKGLNESYLYKYRLAIAGEDGTETDGTIRDNGGNGYQPNASDNSALMSSTILAERIVATDEVRAANIKAGTITADRLAFSAFDIDSDSLDDISDGTIYGRILKTDISAGHILLSETVGDLDDIADGSAYGRVASTDISAGHITVVSEQASININNSTFGSQGIQLQYNGGTPRAYIGDGGSNYIKFDGTNVTISGTLTIQGGSGISNLSDAGALATKDTADYSADVSGTKPPVNADNTKTVIDGGLVTTGYINLSTSGNIRSGQTSYNTGTGFWLGNDSGTPKFSIGDGGSSNYLTWDGSTLTVRGDVVAGDITFDDIKAGTNTSSLVLGSGGYLKSSNYSAGSSGFKIDGGGNAEFNDVTVRGAIITGSGSSIDGQYINSLMANKITSGSFSGQTFTGGLFRTASTGYRAEMSESGYPFRYWDGTTYQFYVDTSGNVFARSLKDADGRDIVLDGTCQSGLIKYFGSVGTLSSGTGYWTGEADSIDIGDVTVPSGRQWVIQVFGKTPDFWGYDGYDPNETDQWVGFNFRHFGYFYQSSSNTYYGPSLSAGDYTSLSIVIYHVMQIMAADSNNNIWATMPVFYMILEVPA